MKVADVMSRKVVTVTENASFSHLWRSIFKHRIHALPVVGARMKLVGIITREDILQTLYPNFRDVIEDFASATDFEGMEKSIKEAARLKAGDVMNRKVIYTRADTPIMRALSRMIVRDVAQLPVVDDDDSLVGLVSKGDIFYALFRRNFAATGRIPKRRHIGKK